MESLMSSHPMDISEFTLTVSFDTDYHSKNVRCICQRMSRKYIYGYAKMNNKPTWVSPLVVHGTSGFFKNMFQNYTIVLFKIPWAMDQTGIHNLMTASYIMKLTGMCTLGTTSPSRRRMVSGPKLAYFWIDRRPIVARLQHGSRE